MSSKLSNLTAVTSPQSGDGLYIIRGGVSYKITVDNLFGSPLPIGTTPNTVAATTLASSSTTTATGGIRTLDSFALFAGAVAAINRSAFIYTDGIHLSADYAIKFSSNPATVGDCFQNTDIQLVRFSADTFGMQRGAAAQTFGITLTYTDAGNYSRVKMTAGSTFAFSVDEAGTGVGANTGGYSFDKKISAPGNYKFGDSTTTDARAYFPLQIQRPSDDNPTFRFLDNLLEVRGALSIIGNFPLTLGGSLIIAGGSAILGCLTAVATLDFPSSLGLAAADLTMTVTGAAVGDVVDIGAPNGSVPANGSFFAWVSATNTVTIRYLPLVAGDPASGSFRATIWKF